MPDLRPAARGALARCPRQGARRGADHGLPLGERCQHLEADGTLHCGTEQASKKVSWPRCIAFATALVFAGPAYAMDFGLSPDGATVTASGEILAGDGQRFADFLAGALRAGRRPSIVALDSAGGHPLDAIALGRVFRGAGLATETAHCASGCVYAFVGGVRRRASDGALALHFIAIDRAGHTSPESTAADRQATEALATRVALYFAEMGVSPLAIRIAQIVPPEGPLFALTRAEAETLGLDTAQP